MGFRPGQRRDIPLRLYRGSPMPQAKKPHRIASGPRKQQPKGQMTHEAIAADIDAFRDKGGKIEVLGVTRTLLRVDAAPVQPPNPDTDRAADS